MARTITVNLSSPDIINMTGKWTFNKYLKVSYSWSNAPSGMKSTVPIDSNKYKSGDLVSVDGTMTATTAYKDESAKKYYTFSGWNKSDSFNISSDINISGSWDNGKSVGLSTTLSVFNKAGTYISYNPKDQYYYFIYANALYRTNDLSSSTKLYTPTKSGSTLEYVTVLNNIVFTFGTYAAVYSTDGTTYSEFFGNSTISKMTSLIYYNDIYILSSIYNPYSSGSNIYVLSYGSSYTSLTSTSVSYCWYNNQICDFKNILYAFSFSNYHLYKSTNGINWTDTGNSYQASTSIASTSNYLLINYSGNNSPYTPVLIRSSDGTTFSQVNGNLSSYFTGFCNVYSYNDYFFIVGYNNPCFIYSSDGVTWNGGIKFNKNTSSSNMCAVSGTNDKVFFGMNALEYINNSSYPRDFSYIA